MVIALEYDEVVHTCLFEPDGHAEARETCTYYDLVVLVSIHSRENNEMQLIIRNGYSNIDKNHIFQHDKFRI